MFFTRLYYNAKPWMPWRMRIFLRRLRARRLRARARDHWPILESAGNAPEGWEGWPEGRQFAVVLTHDVEGPLGLERVRRVAEIDRAAGFRSSFNFIPEGGEYAAGPDLRGWLAREGFEVGVHDLFHDGKLYRSREGFRQNARKINEYLQAWDARGFRSGFMHHNLEWLHDLEVLYDCSTFDTDPFEPQPDGVETIFPFWVPGAGHEDQGYAELPYTLTQDFSMFVLFREADIGLWKRKVDWIAERGGMVLLNTHPDYMSFDRPGASEYPARLYSELLEYIRARYAGRYWAALPREVGELARERRPRKPPTPKSVAMVVYSYYETDNRVMRYAEALARRGDRVDVLALHDGRNRPDEEVIEGVKVFRIQKRIGKREKSRWSHFWPLVRFTMASSLALAARHGRARYDVVHVHNVPDFLVFAAWFPRLVGARVILDIHDIVPEFYASKFGQPVDAPIPRLLQRVERCAARFAHHVIVSNHLWRDKLVARSAPAECCSVFINYIDPTTFYRRARTRRDDRLIVLFHGGLQWHQGLDLAIRAFARIRAELPTAELHIYGEGNQKEKLMALIAELELADRVRIFEPVGLKQIPQIIADADLGVVPKRANSFGNEAYSTKIMEFMSQGVPVLISSTRIDRYYFKEGEVRFFESENVDALAAGMLELLTREEERARLVKATRQCLAENNWQRKQFDYLRIVDCLAGDWGASMAHSGPAEDFEELARPGA